MNEPYYSPGDGRLKLNRNLTDEEKLQYIRWWLESKGLCVLPEDIVVEDGIATVKAREK